MFQSLLETTLTIFGHLVTYSAYIKITEVSTDLGLTVWIFNCKMLHYVHLLVSYSGGQVKYTGIIWAFSLNKVFLLFYSKFKNPGY